MYGDELGMAEVIDLDPMGARSYVVAFRNGTVKVGFTERAARRLPTLAREARQQGNALIRIWLSTAHERARHSERSLIKYCAEVGARPAGCTSGEYFVGLDFDQVVAAATGFAAEHITAEASAVGQAPSQGEAYVPDEFSEWIDRHPLSCMALVGEILRGELALIDSKTGAFIDPRYAYRLA